MSKRYVNVELGGKGRQLRFDFNAVSDLEDYFGKGIGAILSEEQVGFQVIRAMYWAGLKWNNRGLTLPKVGDWLQEKMEEGMEPEELFEPVVKALQYAGLLGSTEDIEEEEQEEKN